MGNRPKPAKTGRNTGPAAERDSSRKRLAGLEVEKLMEAAKDSPGQRAGMGTKRENLWNAAELAAK